MKCSPRIDKDDEGIVCWFDDDGERERICVDVETIFVVQAGVSFSPTRARRLASELIELADLAERRTPR